MSTLAGLGVDGQDPASGVWLAELKADPGQVGRDTLRSEIAKLARVRGLGLPDQLFEGWSDKLISAWRARAAAEYPSDLRSHDRAVRLTLLAALAWTRQGEIVDGLVDLLIALVHKIASHAEQGAQTELVAKLLALSAAERPSAVFAVNDLVAIGLLQGLVTRGVQVPWEIAHIGYDDIEFASAATVPLFSARKPRANLGRQAAGLLLADIDAPLVEQTPPTQTHSARADTGRARVLSASPHPGIIC